MAKSIARSRASNTLAMTVDDTGFLLDRLGEDCHPLQFLRELTQNSIEAIGRTPDGSGEIIWDVDWNGFELNDVRKLCVIDTGVGMTGEDMVRYINQLSSSISKQSMAGNYGVGAKISAATRNHHGLIYLSWRDGKGSMIHLWRDPETGQYGLRQIERPDGTFSHFGEVEDDIKPEAIDQNGTMVVLMGNDSDEDTIEPPPSAPSPSRWIAKYLNSRYFEIPPGIKLKAREGWKHPRSDTDRNLLRSLVGQKAYLSEHAQTSGQVALSGATAHWWILKDESAMTQNSGFIESSGHTAALYNGELYEMSSGRSGMARLQEFGVILGHRRVVIYVEPDCSASGRVSTNTARTTLLIENQPLPWADWCMQFRDKMPEEIERLIEEVAAGSSSADHSKSIRERLKNVIDLFKVSRYRPTPSGDLELDEDRVTRGGQPRARGERTKSGTSGGRSSKGGTAGGVYSVFLKKGGPRGTEVNPDLFPEVRWITVSDGTRVAGDIEDRAARYLDDQNLLLINADFRAFEDMRKRWMKEYKGNPAVETSVRDAVRGWFEQSLIETVVGVKALENSKEWSIEQIHSALSEEALTTAVMPRYHVHNSVKRELGAKLGKLKAS